MRREREKSSTVLLAWNKLVPASEGQDPLGLNLRVSARISNQLLHCITSITPRARYFSFFPWCIAEYNRRKDKKKPSLRDTIRLWEKALTLGCVLHHDGRVCEGGNLVGSKQAIDWLRAHPNETPRFSKLSFSKNPALDAYFNSMVHLGFFVADGETPEEVAPDEVVPVVLSEVELTPLGEEIATAYGQGLGNLAITTKLGSQPDSCSPRQLEDFGKNGGLCEIKQPNSPDREILKRVFFNQVGSPGESHRFRRESLVLLLQLCNQLGHHGVELDADAFSDAVYFGKVCLDDEDTLLDIKLPNQLIDTATRWRMFHFHFYLSVALESLFVAIVSTSRSTGIKGFRLESMVETLSAKTVRKYLATGLLDTLRVDFLDSTPRELFKAAGVDILSADAEGSVKLDGMLHWAHPFSESSLALSFHKIDRDTPEGITAALMLLIAATARFIQWENTAYGNWLAQEVRDTYKDVTLPVVIRELRERFPDYWNISWREIAIFVLRRFVVRQHEVMAYDKHWDGSKAFFHTENDLIRWRELSYDEIGVRNGRFSRALQILRDLALVEQNRPGLTKDGVRWLNSELAEMATK